MFIVSGAYKITPGKRDEFMKNLYDAGIPAACRKEKGNLSYDYYYPVDSEVNVYFVERWTDRDCWEAHKVAPHVVSELQAIKAQYLTGFEPGLLGELVEQK